MRYASIPHTVEAAQYDGTRDSLVTIRGLLLQHQHPAGEVSIIGAPPYLRRPDRPDQPLLPGYWITISRDGYVALTSPQAFSRRFTAG